MFTWCDFEWTQDGERYRCSKLMGHGDKPDATDEDKDHVSGDGTTYEV